MSPIPYRGGLLERFGIYYLRLFRASTDHPGKIPADETLNRHIRQHSRFGSGASAILGVLLVLPMVWISVQTQGRDALVHYGLTWGLTAVLTLVEFYFLFLIALRMVHRIAESLHIHATDKEYLFQGPFSILNILSRTALEIDEPELNLLGINPFRQVSKTNLLLLSLLYKGKIILSNLVLKFLFLKLVGTDIGGISIDYIALPVEAFWNALVLRRVAHEARLRLTGFILANQITDNLRQNGLAAQLTPEGRITVLRAIGNAVVMAQNYHPNMMILLLEFIDMFQIEDPGRLDDWSLFLERLQMLDEGEKNFVLDTLCVAAAFDGRITHLERQDLQVAFGESWTIYQRRMEALRKDLTSGKLHAALSRCTLDFVKG